MVLIGTLNTNSQVATTNSLINLGSTYRQYKKKPNHNSAFTFNGTSITLNHSGIYRVVVNAIFTAPTTGDVSIQLLNNGVAIDGALANETIGTADTETRSVSFETYVLVNTTYTLGITTTNISNISLSNSGIGATFTNIKVDIEKVV